MVKCVHVIELVEIKKISRSFDIKKRCFKENLSEKNYLYMLGYPSISIFLCIKTFHVQVLFLLLFVCFCFFSFLYFDDLITGPRISSGTS